MKLLNRILLFTVMMVALYYFGVWTLYKDAELMKVDYCWDSSGQHYVAPNDNCILR